jgi:hypothetical protein
MVETRGFEDSEVRIMIDCDGFILGRCQCVDYIALCGRMGYELERSVRGPVKVLY